MLRKEFAIPESTLEDIKMFLTGKTKVLKEIRLSNKYDDIEISVLLEKSPRKSQSIRVFIGVTKGSSFPVTSEFEINNYLDLLKVYDLKLNEILVLIKFVPYKAKFDSRDYILQKPLLEDGMGVRELTNYTNYISFNDKVEFFYLLYNLLLNEYYINISPSNVRTNLNLINILIGKFEYFGYDKEFLLDNSHLESADTFTSSDMILDKFIFHVLNNLFNKKKCGLSILQLRNLFDAFYNLLEKESR